MQFILEDVNMTTYMEPGVLHSSGIIGLDSKQKQGLKGYALACMKNNNLLERMKKWKDCLPGTFHRGCAINSLVFMGEMSFDRGCVEGKRVIDNQPLGTPYDHIINWFNIKHKKNKNNMYFKEFVKSMYDFNGDILPMITFFEETLPDDSCTIVKLNRKSEDYVKYNLCPGHTILIGKDQQSNLWFVDPQKKIYLPMRNNMDTLSSDFMNQFYHNFSIPVMVNPENNIYTGPLAVSP